MLTVRSPASSGNLGAGFDALSLALELCSEFSARPATELRIENFGEAATSLPDNSDNLVYQAICRVFRVCERPAPAVWLRCENRIPLSRGLGSSSSAVAAGLLLGNRLLGDPLSLDDLLVLGSEMEGHPDNVVSCLLGGMQVSVEREGRVLHSTVPMNLPLTTVLFIPDFAMDTREARQLLPRQVPLEDAVFNVGRAALLVAGLANGQKEVLRAATEDRLHQPPRSVLFPAMPAMFEAALEAGALAACLSGAGSTILTLTSDRVAEIGAALERCAARNKLDGVVRVVPIRQRGAEILES
jgi:homoserine kinase